MASAMLAIPSHAQDAAPAATPAPIPAPVPPAAPPKLPELMKPETSATLRAAQKEVLAAVGKEVNAGKMLELYTKFQFSPELQPKLKEIFGTERPFAIQRVANGPKGQINYVGGLAPYTYLQGNGTDFTWTEMALKLSTDKAGRALNTDSTWPSLMVTRPGGSLSLNDISMTTRAVYGADQVGYGTALIKVGSVVVRDSAPGSREIKEMMRFEGIEGKSDVRRRGAMAEIVYSNTIKAIVIGDERVERSNFAFRITNVPAKALADMNKQLRDQQGADMENEAEKKRVLKTMTDFGKRMVTAGATLFIDDISAAYHGNVASLKGRVSFQKVVEADFSNFNALMKKIAAHFEVRVPVALVRDVARVFAGKSVDPSLPDAAKQIDAGADAVVSMVVGKTVSGGFGVVVQDELRTVIDIKDGKVTINGKPIEVPAGVLNSLKAKPAPQPAQAPVPAAKPAPAPKAEAQ
jgi:hypothetical protein